MPRSFHMLLFLAVFALILVAAHVYLFARISYYLQLTASQRRTAALILGSLALLAFISLPITRVLPREAATVLSWLVFPWMGFLLLMLVAMMATDAAWFLLNLVPPAPMHDPARRAFIQKAFGIAALGATGLLGGYALWNGLRPVRVKPLTIALKRLPKSMDSLRIVQITDLHLGPIIDGKWLHDVVDKVNALKPDLIVVTGDFADGPVSELGRLVTPIGNLKAPLGVYFVTGNHEYYNGVEAWCAKITSLGLRVLRNERVTITEGNNGESFDLAGVDDWASSRFPGEGPNLPKALKGRDNDKMLLLLAHQPAAVDEASAHGVDLQLSGHTHGGQIWPFGCLVRLQQPYIKGLHRHRDTDMQIYVSQGTGFWGPPMRFGTSAEITHITLRCA